MKRFKAKPKVIEAFQWNGTQEAMNQALTLCDQIEVTGGKLKIMTLEGVMTASSGDWIIKGIRGEFYPCKPDIFKDCYEEIPDYVDPAECDNHGDDAGGYCVICGHTW